MSQQKPILEDNWQSGVMALLFGSDGVKLQRVGAQEFSKQ